MAGAGEDEGAIGIADLRAIYGRSAPCMDRIAPIDRLVLGRYRRHFARAEGRVLDVACGTGTNAPFVPDACDLVGIDASPAMARRAASRIGTVAVMDAEHLAFPDGTFDTVISALSTCTFPHPAQALREMARVCRPDGRILLLEHGRSWFDPLADLQAWYAPRHYRATGCRLTQEPREVVAGAGLDILAVEEDVLGIFTRLVARPPDRHH